MQVLVLAAQNAVDYRLLGVATSGATLFRQVGGSIGVSVFGAIFTAAAVRKTGWPPPPSPWIALNAISCGMLCASPQSADPMRKSTSANCRTRLWP
jgi:hypothetical protein